MNWNAQKVLWTAITVASLALILGVVTMPKSAKADGIGCHVGVQGGMASTTSQTSVAFAGTSIVDINGIGTSGAVVGIGGGCDFVVDRILVGAFADYSKNNSSFSGSVPIMGASLGMDLDRQWTVGARTGVMLGETLVYALAGWTSMSTTGLSGAVNGSFGDFAGMTLGGGIETPLGKHVKLAIEGRHTQFDSRTASLSGAGLPPDLATATMKPEQTMVLLRLNYALDFFGTLASK